MFSYILPFIVLILVVVFIHEYGHYYFAKRYGVGVTDFSIGFGQEIFGWNDKSGTRWKICWIPLGGYVKFFGDRNVFSQADQEKILKKYNQEDRQKLFVLKPLYQRVLIVFGGPLANFLLALVIFFSIYTFIGKDFTPAVINEVQKDSPAMIGGLKQNDIILEIDGNKVKSIMDVSKYITMSTDDVIDFKIKRSYDELILKIKPDIVGDFTNIKQLDNYFWHIVFDPPHITQKAITGDLTKRYGILQDGWQDMIRKGFEECFRVLKPNGTLIFKWSEVQIPIKDVLKLTKHKPLYGHKSGKRMNTHWVCFIKD